VNIALHGKVLGPLAIAVLACLPHALPAPRPPAIGAASPVAMPRLHGLPDPKRPSSFELDAEASSVGILVHDGDGDRRLRCEGVLGTLHFDADGTARLELHIPLTALHTDDDGPPIDLPRLLGVHRGDEIALRANLAATTTSDLPGVTARTWVGTLTFGSQVRRQLLETWTCFLPGRPFRLQGHGTVPASDYGLPRRGLFSFLDAPAHFTLGLDLAFRRPRQD